MYSLSFTGFFKQCRIKNIWSPPGIKPRTTTCIAHKRSATELQQPPGKQTFQFCIYTVKFIEFFSSLPLNSIKYRNGMFVCRVVVVAQWQSAIYNLCFLYITYRLLFSVYFSLLLLFFTTIENLKERTIKYRRII